MSGLSLFRRRSRSRIPAQVLARGRQGVDALADTLSSEALAAMVRDLQREVAPLVERATGRTRRRGPGRGFLVVLLLGAAATIAYLLWQRRDEQPAYLMDEPERPSVTPAGSPNPVAPPPAPGAPSPAANEEDAAAALQLTRSMVDRELAGARSRAPSADREVRGGRDLPPREVGFSVPSMPGGAAGMPWASGRPQVPGSSRPSLPH